MASLMSDGLSFYVMGDDGTIKYTDDEENTILLNLDYRTCDFSLTAWEVYGTLMAEVQRVAGPERKDLGPLVKFLALSAVTNPTWVNGMLFTRTMGMISGIGGTSDNDRRVVLARMWMALKAGGYEPGCKVRDINTDAMEAQLRQYGTLKMLEVHRGIRSEDFYMENFNWISHKFAPRADDPRQVAFLPSRDKLFAALYAHSNDVTVTKEPSPKAARAIGLTIS